MKSSGVSSFSPDIQRAPAPCVLCAVGTERLTYKEISYHGAESGPIDARSVAEQFHSEKLNHPL